MRRILAALGFAVFLLGMPLQAGTAAAAAPVNKFYWGQCTWWAANVRPDIGSQMSGNAANWIYDAMHDPNLTTGTAPQINAIVVYPPGDQGAWSSGHVAHVISVAPDGQSFTVDEMDYPIPGVVTHRVSHVDPRIVFIY